MNRMRAAAAAGAALIRADITARVPIAVMWAPTISPTVHNITGRTLTPVTVRTLTQPAGTTEGTPAGIIAGFIAANTVTGKSVMPFKWC